MGDQNPGILRIGTVLAKGVGAMMHRCHAWNRTQRLADLLQDGDLIFIACGTPLFRRISGATGCWANHVGIAFRSERGNWVVYESAVPLARRTPLALYLARGGRRQVVVARPRGGLTAEQLERLRKAASNRLGRRYDFAFNYDGTGQFCSKFVHDCYQEATGADLGRLQTFADLHAEQPDHPLGAWKLWFLGRIPWRQRTVTPASLLNSPAVSTVCTLGEGN